jgi:uncharacterized membrane protein
MSLLSVPEALAGLLLVFFVPGYALTRAVFPEWRLRPPHTLRVLVETLTLSFVLSLVLTVLVGYLLLSVAPGGFRAFWSDPVLEGALFALAVAALGIAAARGAFAKVAPAAPPKEDRPGEEGAWELSRELDRLQREERRLRHDLRVSSGTPTETAALRERLREVQAQTTDLARRREAEYAQ